MFGKNARPVDRCPAVSESDCRCLDGILITPALASDFQTQGASESVHIISQKTDSPLTRTFRGTNGYLLLMPPIEIISITNESSKLHLAGSKIHPQTSTMDGGMREKTPEIQSMTARWVTRVPFSGISPPSNNFEKAPMKHTPNSRRTTHFPDSVPFCDVESAMYNFCVSSRG